MKKIKFYETDPRWKRVKQLCLECKFEEANEVILKMQEEYKPDKNWRKAK